MGAVVRRRSLLDHRPKRGIETDVPTMIAVSTVAWALADALHEVVGHAGAAVLLGVPVRAVSTATVFIEADQIRSVWDYRIIHAAPTLINLVSAGLALLALHSRWARSSTSRYFLWLFATISVILATVNLVFGPLGGGDWMEVTTELEPRVIWRAGIVAVGVAVGVAGYVLPLRLWRPDLREHRRLQLKVTTVPVLVVVVVQTLSVVGSPFASQPVGSSQSPVAGLGLVYLTMVLWLALVNVVGGPHSLAPVESIRLTRSKGWLAVGLLMLVIFVGVLGPGLGPLEDDPRLI